MKHIRPELEQRIRATLENYDTLRDTIWDFHLDNSEDIRELLHEIDALRIELTQKDLIISGRSLSMTKLLDTEEYAVIKDAMDEFGQIPSCFHNRFFDAYDSLIDSLSILRTENEDLASNLECLLDHATGGKYSNSRYTIEAMREQVDEYVHSLKVKWEKNIRKLPVDLKTEDNKTISELIDISRNYQLHIDNYTKLVDENSNLKKLIDALEEENHIYSNQLKYLRQLLNQKDLIDNTYNEIRKHR